MKLDFAVKLTDKSTKPETVFEFSRYETPERIVFGGEQALVVHRLVGGGRVVDAMGKSDKPPEWEGMFFGENALSRARYIDGLRTRGVPLELTWSAFSYRVVIRNFEASFERSFQIPYEIQFEYIVNRTDKVSSVSSAGIDGWIRDDMKTASALGLQIGDGPLSSALGTLDGAIKGVSDFAKATTATIKTVLGPLAVAQQRIKLLIGSTANTLGNIATLGGILPGNPVSRQLGSINRRVNAATQLPQLYNLQSTLNRMGGNLNNTAAPSKTIVQAGGNLYQLGAENLGTPAAWADIAKANNMSNPELTGINSIKIPATTTSGGVLSK